MGDFDMNAAVAEYTNMTSGEEATPEAAPEQAAPEAAKPTAQEIANFFETQLDGKPMKLPYNLELPLKHNGQVMNVPLEKLANTYRQFDHIQNKHKEFQTKQQEFEAKVGDWKKVEEMKQKFGSIQEWSEQNPQEFERLWQLYQAKDQILAGQEFNPLVPKISTLEQQLQEIRKETEYYRSLREQEAAQKDTALIDGQIAEFQKEYAFLDLKEKDLDGIDLETRIIQHGIANKHPDFLSAAFTFPGLRQRLIEGVRENVKAESVKQIKQDSKNGIIARTPTPTTVKAGDLNVKRLSPQERDKRMLEELSGVFGK